MVAESNCGGGTMKDAAEETASIAVQEAQPQLAFKATNLAAHSRLREPDDRACMTETSGFGDVNEGLDLPQVHGAGRYKIHAYLVVGHV